MTGITRAQLLRYSPPSQTGLSYTFAASHPNITGSDSDIFMQIQGPTSKSWIALGQGSSMTGSQIFIVYANAAGNSVTLSPRLGGSHQEPSAQTNSSAVLLAGSGIANGNMTANILCSNCSSWNSGSMNLNGSAQPWIWASRSGDPIKSDSATAHIQMHDQGSYAAFGLDLNDMTPDNSSNPFLDLENSQIIDVRGSNYHGIAIPLHGVVMCLAFIIGFPFGAFLIRLASLRGLVWIHAGIQLLSYLATIMGLGLGVHIVKKGAADVSLLQLTGLLTLLTQVLDQVLPSDPWHCPHSPPHLPARPRLYPPSPV